MTTSKTPRDPLWQKVSKTVTPLRAKSSHPQSLSDDFRYMMRVPPTAKPVRSAALPDVDLNRDKKVRRGRVAIDAKIDLHDMTSAQAFPALCAAVKAAHKKKQHCLLVVTGKGLRLNGVLRNAFPLWINHEDIRPMIATYAQAHIHHGGSGAWYIFLKSH